MINSEKYYTESYGIQECKSTLIVANKVNSLAHDVRTYTVSNESCDTFMSSKITELHLFNNEVIFYSDSVNSVSQFFQNKESNNFIEKKYKKLGEL